MRDLPSMQGKAAFVDCFQMCPKWPARAYMSPVADKDLLPGLDQHRVGHLPRVAAVLVMQQIRVHPSSVPGPDGVAEAMREVEREYGRGSEGPAEAGAFALSDYGAGAGQAQMNQICGPGVNPKLPPDWDLTRSCPRRPEDCPAKQTAQARPPPGHPRRPSLSCHKRYAADATVSLPARDIVSVLRAPRNRLNRAESADRTAIFQARRRDLGLAGSGALSG